MAEQTDSLSGSRASRGARADDILAQAFGGETPAEEGTPTTEGDQDSAEEIEAAASGEGESPELAAESGEESGGEEAEGEDGAVDWENLTVAELAEAIEVDPAYLYSVKMPIAGTDEVLALGDIKDRLQEAAVIKSQQSKVEQERATLQQEKAQWEQTAAQGQQQFMQLPQEVIEARAKMISLQHAWDYLENNRDAVDPGELALKKQELQSSYNAANQTFQNSLQQMQQATQQSHKDRLLGEAQQLLVKVPEWKDAQVATKDRTGMDAVLSQYGFPQAEVNRITDHRILWLLRDFMKMKAGLDTATEQLNTGRKVPKVLKPGTPARKTAVSKAKLKEKIQRAKSTKNLRRKGAMIGELLSSGEM